MTATESPAWTESQEFVVVLVTCPQEKAGELARALVAAKLIGCANIIPAVRSVYSWKGSVCDDSEALLVLKTREELLEQLRAAVLAQHPYEVPEIIALPIQGGHAAYLQWLGECTRP